MTPVHVAATRRLLGLTADQLGQALDINPRTIRGWEAGKYTPSETATQALLGLRAEHDAELATMLQHAKAGAVEIPGGPKARGWYLALAARLIDRLPDARVTWRE